MSISQRGPVDHDRAAWNDDMYLSHPTPYARGLAGRIERERVRTVLRLAAVRPGDAVLEVGCESGTLLAAVPPCRRLVGIDISARALADARVRFERASRAVELYQVDAERGLPFAGGEFEVVICSEVLEHVRDPVATLAHIREIATAETRIVVSIPIEGPKVWVKKLLDRLGLLDRLLPGIEKGQSEWHAHALSPQTLDELVSGSFVYEGVGGVSGLHYVALLHAK